MRRLLALAVLALAGCEGTGSFEQACERRLAPTSVRVVTQPVSYATDFTRSASQLTAKGAARAGRTVLGLVQTEIRTAADIRLAGMKQTFRDRYCMRPAVEMKLAFGPMTLFIAAEQPEGSCAFKVTMAHELKHVAVYQAFLEEFARETERELHAALGDQVLYFGSAAAADAHVQAVLARELKPRLEAAQTEVAARQRRVDSVAEYARLDAAQAGCGPP